MVVLLLAYSKDVMLAQDNGAEQFNISKDLLLLHYDFKTDVDDLHSVAAFGTLHAIPKFSAIQYHAVAGAYGMQEGKYVPPNELCKMTFGENWSDAHNNFEKALNEVREIAIKTLAGKGDIWIADGGQSDFSAALVKTIVTENPELDIDDRIHIIQHADWNEEVTTPAKLAYVKEHTVYHKIPDGNAPGNGTPGFRFPEKIDLKNYITDPKLLSVWEKATSIANQYNGKDGRYLNEAIQKGGLDFSDFSEVCWILGLTDLKNSTDFFEYYSKRKN